MGVASLVDALDVQDDTLALGMVFEERVKLAVDDAHATFTHAKVEGLIRRAGLRYPNADLRRLDLVEQRGLDRGVIAQLGTCAFITRQQNVVFQGFTGSGKSYLGSRAGQASLPAPLSEPTTSACPTSKNPGQPHETNPAGRKSGCANMRRSRCW